MPFQIGNSLSLTHKPLKDGDYTIRPFQVNKLWEFKTEASEYEHYKNFGINVYRAFYPENHKYFGNVANVSSSMYERIFTTQSLDPKILWYYLDHNFYTEYKKEKYPTMLTDYNQITYLGESASLFVIPVGVFGEGIKKKSVSLTNINTSSKFNYTIIDDGNGNLTDTSFDETNFMEDDSVLLYLGFNEKYREYQMKNNKLDYVLDMSSKYNNVSIKNSKKIRYESGIPTTDTSQSTGVCATFDGTYLQVEDGNNFNFTNNEDFGFSFWIKVPPQQKDANDTRNYIFNKNTIKDVYVLNETTLEHEKQEIQKSYPNYPFNIYLNNQSAATPNSITFEQCSNYVTASVSSTALSSSVWHHVLCQRSSSYYQIWIDGILNSSVEHGNIKDTANDNKFYIAGNGVSGRDFSGSLDEIRIFNKAVPSAKVPYLYQNTTEVGYAYQTSRVGNVFYGNGFLVVSDPRPKYANAFLGSTGNYDFDGITNGFSGKFRGTTTFYQYEVICKIRKNEFNFTQNSSVRTDRFSQNDQLENYVTSSFFRPFITTVGLYNSTNDLVAIAKLANPLEKRNDVDMNIIIRFDM